MKRDFENFNDLLKFIISEDCQCEDCNLERNNPETVGDSLGITIKEDKDELIKDLKDELDEAYQQINNLRRNLEDFNKLKSIFK